MCENFKLIVADSAALTNTATGTVMTKSNGDTYELVFPAYGIPVDASRGCLLRIKGAVQATATHTSDTLATLIQVGKTGTMTTVAATDAYDAADNNIFLLEAEVLFRSTSALVAMGRGQYTGLTAPQLTLVASTAYDPASPFRVQVKCTWSAADTGNSCKVLYLYGELMTPAVGVTAALS